jgi:hypothetical protein
MKTDYEHDRLQDSLQASRVPPSSCQPILLALIITAGIISIVSTGCAARYRPKAALPNTYFDQVLKDVTQPDLLKTYNALPEKEDAQKTTKVARRNQILQELIILVDRNYSNFENQYYGSDASINFAGDFVNLGLTGVSSVTGTAHLKSVLSAVATGTTGIKTSYLKNYYDQQTRGAIVQKMRSLRASQLATIQDANHMKAGPSNYSLESGLSDIDAYYNAGTIVGALQGISETAGTEQTAAKAQQKTNGSAKQSIQ